MPSTILPSTAALCLNLRRMLLCTTLLSLPLLMVQDLTCPLTRQVATLSRNHTEALRPSPCLVPWRVHP